MHAAFVDIENEFREIEQEAAHLELPLKRHNVDTTAPDAQYAWELVHVLASATEKIYTGCERVMNRVAQGIDGTRIGHGDGWHLALLRRMANPFPNVRDAVISSQCYGQSDRLRAFHHRERNTYGLNLDLDVVLERAREAISAVRVFHEEVRAFFVDKSNESTATDEPSQEPH